MLQPEKTADYPDEASSRKPLGSHGSFSPRRSQRDERKELWAWTLQTTYEMALTKACCARAEHVENDVLVTEEALLYESDVASCVALAVKAADKIVQAYVERFGLGSV
jgi:hypothetical protein